MPVTPAQLKKKVETFPWDDWAEEFKSTYGPIYNELVKLGAQVSMSELLDFKDPFVSRFITDYVGERIVQLQDTTKEDVIRVVQRELEAGTSKTPFELGTKVLDSVREKFDSYERYRADRIARTETGFGFNHGTVLGAAQSGFEEVDVTDGDSDPECEDANGQVWSIDDALANPLEHPNCVRAFAPHVE